MKTTKLLMAASIAVLSLSAATISSANAQDTVAVIVKATTSEYWQWVFKGAEAAGKQLGVKVDELGTPNDDAAGQIHLRQDPAAKNVAGRIGVGRHGDRAQGRLAFGGDLVVSGHRARS